jgi:glutaredoxin-like protein NrdH
MNPVVTVYTTLGCPGCTLTKAHMAKRGIAFTEVSIDDDTRAAITFLGFTSAPVVCARTPEGREVTWAGYRPDSIDALVVTA